MSERKTYVILGLGRFGSTLAKQLTNFNQDVIAIDKDIALVEKLSSSVANALCLDYTDVDALAAAGVKDADVGIVTTGSMLDQEIQGVVNLKDLGVPYVVCKANNLKTGNLLKKIGADSIVSPEYDMAVNCAKKLLSNDILELFNIDNDNTVIEMKVPTNWVSHSLMELDLRTKFSINVIGIKHNGKLSTNIDPNAKFSDNDEILVVGPNDIFKNFEEITNI